MTARRRQRIHTCHYFGCNQRTTADRPMCSMHWNNLDAGEKGRVYAARADHSDCGLKHPGGGIPGVGVPCS